VSIQQGNERVVMPRLADAEFFWDQDRKLRLEERVEQLDSMIFSAIDSICPVLLAAVGLPEPLG
jgi:glycyl-tRNA synthetase beta subunit